MHALVKLERGKPRILQIGPRNLIVLAENATLVPVENVRLLRPVVAVEEGAVTEIYPGLGYPVVVDLDEYPAEYYVVGIDDAEIVDTVKTLRKAFQIAQKALKTATWKVDLELQDAHRNILAVYTLYEEVP